RASIGLWDEQRQRLLFHYTPPSEAAGLPGVDGHGSVSLAEDTWEVDPSSHPVSGQAFVQQRALLITDVERADPPNTSLYRAYKSRSALAAPITAGSQRLGVLLTFAPRAPVFANSDLELMQLMADQAAVILESRAL